MRSFAVGKIFDFLFFSILIFLTVFVWSRYFLGNSLISVLIGAIVTFFVMTIFHFLTIKKRDKTKKQVEMQENASLIANSFLLSSKADVLKTFYKNLEKKYDVKIKSDYLIINESILRPIYMSQTISDKDIFESYLKIKKTSARKLIVVCKDATESAIVSSKLVTDKEVIVLTELEAYQKIFEPLGFEIPKIQKPKQKKKTFEEYLAFALNKSRTKNYLLVAIFMFFSSFVLRYNLYYLLFSTITTILALYSHFNTRFNKNQQKIL